MPVGVRVCSIIAQLHGAPGQPGRLRSQASPDFKLHELCETLAREQCTAGPSHLALQAQQAAHSPASEPPGEGAAAADEAGWLGRVALDSSTGELTRRDGLEPTSRKDRKARASRRSTAEAGKKVN